MKISWISRLFLGLMLLLSLKSKFVGSTKDFIKNKRMHHVGSVRQNVRKYLKKVSPEKRKELRRKVWKRKKLNNFDKHPHKRLNRHYVAHSTIVENNVHKNMRKFERENRMKNRKLRREKKIRLQKKRHHEQVIRKKKEKRNLDELRRRMQRRSKGKTLKKKIYPISKTVRPKIVNKKAHHKLSRYLKEEKKQFKKVELKNKKEPVISRDLDDDIKLSDHSKKNNPTSAKLYASKPVLPEPKHSVELTRKQASYNPNAIKLDRKLLEVSDYADFSPKNEYATEQVCQMRQKQAIVIAREIVREQNKRLYEKLTNYLLKGKLLVNLTKQKVNKALASKIKELVKPDHVLFTLDDINKIEHEFQNPMDDDIEDAEDYVTQQTYDDSKGLEGIPDDDKFKWNLD